MKSSERKPLPPGTVIAIAHQAHSGLSEEGRKALLKVETDHLTAYRALTN